MKSILVFDTHCSPTWIIAFFLLWNVLVSGTMARPGSEEALSHVPPRDYKLLAKRCFINDYDAWIQRQNEVLLWLALVRIFNYPLDHDDMIYREAENFRLQRECLRLVERLPVAIGPG